jgi:putative spermidine/putrescine transport system permease protein
MMAGAVFAFIVSFDEIVGVLFITVRRVQTLPKMIWQGIQESIDPTIAAVATLMTVLTVVVMLGLSVWRRR